VTKKRGVISPENRLWLKSQQGILGLTDADIENIDSPGFAKSSNHRRLPGLIMAGIALTMLFAGGIYALMIGGRSPSKICLPETSENCISQSNKSKQPGSLSPSPEAINPSANTGNDVTVNESTDRFPIPTRKPITLTDHQGPVQAVAIAPGQKILATGSNDKTIKLWNLAPLWQNNSENPPDSNQLLIDTLSGHTDRVRTLAISSDGLTLASGGNDRTIKIWDLSPKNERSTYLKSTLTDHIGAIYALAFLPNQNILISGSSDWTIKIWDLNTNQVIKTLEGHQGSIRALAVSADGHTLVSGSTDGTVKVWDLRTRRLQHTLIGHTDLVRTVAISPDGQIIASGSWDNTIKLWALSPQKIANPENNQNQSNSPVLMGTLTGHKEYINSVAFTPDGLMLISGSDDNTIKVWDLHLSDSNPPEKPGELASVKATLTEHNTDILSLAVSGKDEQFPQSYPLLVSGSWDRQIKIWW
jgi:WD40 repeat protein